MSMAGFVHTKEGASRTDQPDASSSDNAGNDHDQLFSDYLSSVPLSSDRVMAQVQMACKELFHEKTVPSNDRLAALILANIISLYDMSFEELLKMGHLRVVALCALRSYRAGEPFGSMAANIARKKLARDLGVVPEFEEVGDDCESATEQDCEETKGSIFFNGVSLTPGVAKHRLKKADVIDNIGVHVCQMGFSSIRSCFFHAYKFTCHSQFFRNEHLITKCQLRERNLLKANSFMYGTNALLFGARIQIITARIHWAT